MDRQKFFEIYPMLKKWQDSIVLLDEVPSEEAASPMPKFFTKKFVVVQS